MRVRKVKQVKKRRKYRTPLREREKKRRSTKKTKQHVRNETKQIWEKMDYKKVEKSYYETK